MESSSTEDDFVVLSLLERKYWVHPILIYREDGEFRRLIKEQRDYHGQFKVYFRMSVAQFDALQVILEPHIKRKTTNVCELRVQGSIFSALCCEKLMNLTIAILDFGVRLYGDSELSKHLSKCLLMMRKKKKKNEPDPIFFYDGRKFRRQHANMIDITWGRIYFLTYENFGLRVQRPQKSLHTEFRKCSMHFFHIHNPKNSSRTETLHTESDAY